jgi:hypothetical protein
MRQKMAPVRSLYESATNSNLSSPQKVITTSAETKVTATFPATTLRHPLGRATDQSVPSIHIALKARLAQFLVWVFQNAKGSSMNIIETL